MLVAAPVSSTKIRFAGLSSLCLARQSARCSAMSGRSCSSARPDFFARQPQPGQRLVHQAEAGRDLVVRQQPRPQFLERDIRPGRHRGGDRRVMRRQLQLLLVALRPGLGLAGGLAPGQRLVDIGHADLEQRRHGLGRTSAVNRRQDPAAQIGRVALPWFPRHRTISVRCNREV
jgi:hypothetical protein